MPQLMDQTDMPLVDLRVYVIMWTILLIPILAINSLKVLVPFSIFGNVISLVALVIAVQYLVTDLPPINSRPSFTSFTGLVALIGNALS